LKYHPDKLKGDDKEKYADVFINLNNHFDTITIGQEFYDYYNIEKQVEEGPKIEEKDMPNHKLIKSFVSLPYFILWAFVPTSYLHKEKRKSKIVCFALTALFAYVEIMFIAQLVPNDHMIVSIIKQVVPQWMTFREFFNLL
jgi:hypothetical protein